MQDTLSGRWHLIRPQPLLPQQAEYRSRGHCSQKLALGIRPEVLVTSLKKYRPRRDQRQEHIRIHRRLVRVVAQFLIIGAKLISESHIQVLDCFAIIATAQSRSAFAGTTGDHHGETRIVSARPKYGLSQSRHSQDRYALRVHALVSLQIIQSPAQTPRPSSD